MGRKSQANEKKEIIVWALYDCLTRSGHETVTIKEIAKSADMPHGVIHYYFETKDEIIGVLYVDNRSQAGMFSPADLSLITAFADQAAMAIQNAKLYQNLQESYDTTLEGWASALELRDKTTEAHTRRVTEGTVKLAQYMGIEGNELIQTRRGAILHDIGKIGIPDSILLKPGKLTPAERAIIEQHPQLAFEMLSKIDFLTDALDIPYCHHEKWDGSGYPRGLKGEEIPLPARIFAIIDVWDALTSDRPYRKAMSQEEVIAYIKKDIGSHFDPEVAACFFDIYENSEGEESI